MKKLLATLLVSAMLLSACGGKTDTLSDTTSTDQASNNQVGDQDDIDDAVVPTDELYTDGEGNYVRDPTDANGELMDGALLKPMVKNMTRKMIGGTIGNLVQR